MSYKTAAVNSFAFVEEFILQIAVTGAVHAFRALFGWIGKSRPPRCRKRLLEVWTGPQAEYDALTPDPDTLYLIS